MGCMTEMLTIYQLILASTCFCRLSYMLVIWCCPTVALQQWFYTLCHKCFYTAKGASWRNGWLQYSDALILS